MGQNLPKSTKTRARCKYYKDNTILKSRNIHNQQHEYISGVFLKNHDLHYDRRKGFITFHTLALKEGYHINEKPDITVNI
jgi:hypothetical protein